jgi:hypothetical protein
MICIQNFFAPKLGFCRRSSADHSLEAAVARKTHSNTHKSPSPTSIVHILTYSTYSRQVPLAANRRFALKKMCKLFVVCLAWLGHTTPKQATTYPQQIMQAKTGQSATRPCRMTHFTNRRKTSYRPSAIELASTWSIAC